MDEEAYSKEEVLRFVREVINAYNSPPNLGMRGVEKFLSDSRNNGKGFLADKILSIVLEMNKEIPYMLGDFHEREIMSQLGYD